MSRKKRSEPKRPLVPGGAPQDKATQRQRLAEFLKLVSWWLGRPPAPRLPPRLEVVLMGLLRGRSEKEIAREHAMSVHTVHQYVKELHRVLKVNSRGELLARFLPSIGNGKATSGANPTIAKPSGGRAQGAPVSTRATSRQGGSRTGPRRRK